MPRLQARRATGLCTFGHHMRQRFFLNWKVLNWENLRIWHIYYKPKPAHDNVPNWQAYLEWYRQVGIEVLEIADETEWRGTGDAFGAPYEGGILERAVWAFVGKRNGKRRTTIIHHALAA